MRQVVRQLKDALVSRQGGGTFLMAVAGAVALGVVPDLVQSWSSASWVLYVAFGCGVALVLLGWGLGRDRGLGIVLALFPPGETAATRVKALCAASQSSHSSTLIIDRRELWPDAGTDPGREERVRMAARMLDARLSEHTAAGNSVETVNLYPTLPIPDAYLMGERLRDTLFPRLLVMHAESGAGDPVVKGVELSPDLGLPLTDAQRELLAPHLESPGDSADPIEVPGVPTGARHRLALIVRLASQQSMVSDAILVARTGRVEVDGGRRHTGYVLDPNDPEGNGSPCGAYLVIDTTESHLPRDSAVFEAMTVHIREQWQRARCCWKEKTGMEPRGVLFYNGPVAVAIALGWVLRDKVDIVPHEMSLLRGSRNGV